MNNTFRPIRSETTTPSSPEQFRLKVLSPESAPPAFTPIIGRPAPALAPAPAPGGPGGCGDHTILSLEKVGSRVQRIHITCGCGQSMQLECDYAVEAA